MRRLVIANVSAMQALDEGAGFYARPSQVRSPATFASTAAELHSFTALPSGCTVPIEALVGTKTRLNTNEWRASHRGSPLPPGSVLEIGQDRFLTSEDGQDQIVRGLVNGVDEYFSQYGKMDVVE